MGTKENASDRLPRTRGTAPIFEESHMETLKEKIRAAEWIGYRWARNHPSATAEEARLAADGIWPESRSGVLSYAFERGWAMAREGKVPEPYESPDEAGED